MFKLIAAPAPGPSPTQPEYVDGQLFVEYPGALQVLPVTHHHCSTQWSQCTSAGSWYLYSSGPISDTTPPPSAQQQKMRGGEKPS